MYLVYLDTFFIYCNFNDNYNSHIIDKIDDVLPEGPYGYKNELVDVTISKNDIVIDAGAWIEILVPMHLAKVQLCIPSNLAMKLFNI